jgi:hypothetical protein
MLHFRSICPLAFLWLLIAVAIEPQAALGADPDLPQARKIGLANSRYRKPTPPATKLSEIPQANLELFHQTILPLFTKNCLPCHGPDRTEGRLRIDQISPNLLSGEDTERWREIYNALSNSAMPPEDEPECNLADSDRELIVDWISQELSKASILSRQQVEHSSFRRLTKYEFRYALEDLLGVSLNVSNRLPPETASQDGFKNSSELLQMSSMQFETCREIGLDALQRAIVGSDRPETVQYRISMAEQIEKPPKRKKDEFFDKDDKDYPRKRLGRVLLNRQTSQGIPFQEGSAQPLDKLADLDTPDLATLAVSPVVLVLPASNEAKWNLDRFLPDEGTMRVRIRAGRSNANPQQHASLRLIFSAHTSNDANFSQVISQRDVPVRASADDPQYITFDIQLQDIQRNPFRKLSTTFPRRDEFLSIRNVSNARGQDDPLCVLIDHIEISTPFHEQWPPKSHRDIFFQSANSGDEALYAREVLAKFLRRAWRRPINPSEIDPFLELLAKTRPEFPSFEAAMVEILATSLASPEFLYITHRSNAGPNQVADRTMDEFELASRLSFFLWSSIPDETLLNLANQARLSDPQVLTAQVDRMLADPRSERFSENFVQQWLGIDGIESVTHIADASLRESMRDEPVEFFKSVVQSNTSLLDFIHSDYVVINETLAKHYGINDVYGPDFQKVAVDEGIHRGGILTHAAMLAINSDGKDSHPLKRGVWMLKRILQDPPPPPPPNVPEVDLTDPEIMKMSLKERIADHRNKPACLSCHSKIDPWGIAFENFDAFGKFRTKINERPVDAKSLLYNTQELSGIDGLKEYLLRNRQDQFCRAMVDKLTSYALGRPMTFSDRDQIDRLAIELRKKDDRLRDLLQLIVTSDLFKSR